MSLLASPALAWTVLIFYGVWTNGPFSFVVFYAGLDGRHMTPWKAPGLTVPAGWR